MNNYLYELESYSKYLENENIRTKDLYYNYIIAWHIRSTGNISSPYKVYRIPMYPEEVQDSINSQFVETRILSRSAPYQSWTGSGPRTLSFSIKLHRDLDYYYDSINKIVRQVGNINELMDEYQALNLPNYISPAQVIPPKITVKIGDGIRITGTPNITYTNVLPINENGIYQQGLMNITIKELDPTDAISVTSIKNARGPGLRGGVVFYD